MRKWEARLNVSREKLYVNYVRSDNETSIRFYD